MIEEDYVSFEVAKLLKEKGFKGDTSCYYVPDSSICWHYQHYQDFDKKDRIECPTLQMAMKWLRKEHNLLIVIDKGENFYAWQLEDNENGSYVGEVVGECSSYEEACEEAIKYCLEKLI